MSTFIVERKKQEPKKRRKNKRLTIHDINHDSIEKRIKKILLTQEEAIEISREKGVEF